MTLDDFLPYILPQCKGCSEEVVTFNVRLAIIELCTEALVWTEYQEEVLSVAGQGTYAYLPAAGQQLAKLISIAIDGQDLDVVAPVIGRDLDRTKSLKSYVYAGMRGFNIRPAPAEDGRSIITFGAVAPSLTADEIPDEFGRYAEAIAKGALSRILKNSGREYSNVALAMELKSEWEDHIGDAKTEALRGLSRTTLRVVPAWL